MVVNLHSTPLYVSGLSISGGTDSKVQPEIKVKAVFPGGAAEAEGTLKVQHTFHVLLSLYNFIIFFFTGWEIIASTGKLLQCGSIIKPMFSKPVKIEKSIV